MTRNCHTYDRVSPAVVDTIDPHPCDACELQHNPTTPARMVVTATIWISWMGREVKF